MVSMVSSVAGAEDADLVRCLNAKTGRACAWPVAIGNSISPGQRYGERGFP
jgi:hypothetical protein